MWRNTIAAKFAKFVEWATDSRYIPLGSHCALCDKKLGFFRTGFWSINAGTLADGVLCATCKEQVERLLATKREWMKASALRQASWYPFNTNNWHRMPLQTAKEMIAAKEEADQRQLAAFGNDKTSLFRIEDAIRIEPAAIQVGVRSMGLKLAIGSSSRNTPFILERIGLSGFFDAIADGNGITRSKPDPEVFLLAAKLIGLQPCECLVVEDARAGVVAACAGGFDCAAIGDAKDDPRAAYHLTAFAELMNYVQ